VKRCDAEKKSTCDYQVTLQEFFRVRLNEMKQVDVDFKQQLCATWYSNWFKSTGKI